MAMKYRVFIGSSSERKTAAEELERLLNERFKKKADIQIWSKAFRLSETNIETLEREASKADFAVLLLTPDDALRIRNKKTTAPRDNITFEIGFFMGCLGRERCYILQERARGLRVATDLLGVTTAAFKKPEEDSGWRDALAPAVDKIVAEVQTLGPRSKDNTHSLEQSRIQQFVKRIAGRWWERTNEDGADHWLNFFEIEEDRFHNSISISASRGFTSAGQAGSHWESNRLIPRLDVERRTVYSHWEGYYLSDNQPHHGAEEITFEGPVSGSRRFTFARGKFWDV